jgi:hypothetical protein
MSQDRSYSGRARSRSLAPWDWEAGRLMGPGETDRRGRLLLALALLRPYRVFVTVIPDLRGSPHIIGVSIECSPLRFCRSS